MNEYTGCLTHSGVLVLAGKICSFWQQRGYRGIRAAIEKLEVDARIKREPLQKRVHYRVRSNIGPTRFPSK